MLLEALPAGLISTSCFAVVAYLGRNKIKYWLNRDLEQLKANFQKELESIKAGHQRELEAYKVSLIAEAEKTKAEQGVRSAVALKFSEQQFTAINTINAACAGMGEEVSGMFESACDKPLFNSKGADHVNEIKRKFELHDKRYTKLTKAIFSASLFMEKSDVEILNIYNGHLWGIAKLAIKVCEYNWSAAKYEVPQPLDEFSKLKSMEERHTYIRDKEAEISELLRRYADKLISMQDLER